MCPRMEAGETFRRRVPSARRCFSCRIWIGSALRHWRGARRKPIMRASCPLRNPRGLEAPGPFAEIHLSPSWRERIAVDSEGIVTQKCITMKTATIRELRSHFPRLEALLFEGTHIAITKRKRVVATLIPAGDTARPDFKARFGGAVPAGGRIEQSAVTLLHRERGE